MYFLTSINHHQVDWGLISQTIRKHGMLLLPVLANFRDMGGSEILSKKTPSIRREAGSICSGKEHKTCNMKARRTPKTNLLRTDLDMSKLSKFGKL